MKVIILKSCLALFPLYEGSGQLDLGQGSRARTVGALTAPCRADIILGGNDLETGDAVIASPHLVVDDGTIRDLFGQDWPMNGDFLTAVELQKAANFKVVEPKNRAIQSELDSVGYAVLRIRYMTVCALLAGDDFHTALLNGAHCWARRMQSLGLVLQTAEYSPSADVNWELVSLVPDNAPRFVIEAACVIDKATVLGLDCYVFGKIVEFPNESYIKASGTEQFQDICKAAVIAGMLGDEKWVNINVAAASVMCMYGRGVSTAEVSKSFSADVLDCLDAVQAIAS